MKRTPAPRKRRNHIAADLRTPKYRKKVVANKLLYTRKDKHNVSFRPSKRGTSIT